MFVHYHGTKAGFIKKGLANEYRNKIVFISGINGKGGCIYTHDNYFSDLDELLKALIYIRGISINGTIYEPTQEDLKDGDKEYSGEGYRIALGRIRAKLQSLKSESNPEGLTDITVPGISEEGEITFNLGSEFLAAIDETIVEVRKLIKEILPPLKERLQNLRSRIIQGDGIKIESETDENGYDNLTISADIIDDSTETEENEELRKKKTWSIDKLREKINAYRVRLKNGSGTEIEETITDNTTSTQINILVDETSIIISDDNKLSVKEIDGGQY